MPTSIDKIAKGYLSTNSNKGKSLSVRYEYSLLKMGRCFVAQQYKNLLLINETVEAKNVNQLRKLLIDNASSYGYIPILIPFKIGEENQPTLEEIESKLNNRLSEIGNSYKLVKNEVREQYKVYYEQLKEFLCTTSNREPNEEYTKIYNLLSDKNFLKRLKLQVARRKINIK